MDRSVLEHWFENHRASLISTWQALVEFPSISADPAFDVPCRECADWLIRHLQRIGFTAQRLPTSSKPVVFAERPGDPEKPVVLIYGHYDVQPVDPLEKWTSPPFKPVMKNNRLYGRGAQDNKGQLSYVLGALEAMTAQRIPTPTIRIIVEGEEESGSGGISASLPAWKDRLRASILMVCDTDMVNSGAPTIVMGLRGIVHLTAVLSGPTHDLHSGVHGGVARNPATEMARLIATLHHPDGRIAVESFYRSVLPPTEEERRLINTIPFDPREYRLSTGVEPIAGEPGFSPAERAAFRPCIDVNGIHSGYGGAGNKTIIPATATAKISARLAAGQDPQEALGSIIAHLEKHAPSGLKLEITEKGLGGSALRLDPKSPVVAMAQRVLAELSDLKTVFRWEGASIPVLSRLAEVSGAEPILVGMGLEEDKAHAPNESFSLDQFKRGFLYVSLFLSRL